jgi:ribosomal protein L37E
MMTTCKRCGKPFVSIFDSEQTCSACRMTERVKSVDESTMKLLKDEIKTLKAELAFKDRVIRKMAETINTPIINICKYCIYFDEDCGQKDCTTGIIKFAEKEVREETK